MFARIKRMAFRTDFDMKIVCKRRPGGEFVPAAAGNLEFVILRMDFGFHDNRPGLAEITV